MPGRATPSRFKGWRIAVLAIVIAALTGPGQTLGVSVFIDHFETDLDLSRSVIAACYLVGTLTASAALPHWGRAMDRHGIRKATTVIAVAFAASLAGMAGVTGIVTLTLGFFLIRMLGQGALSLASAVAVSLWFERRRGLMQGIVVTVSGGLMALVPVGLNQVIEGWGWRTAWLVAAGAIAIVVIPVAWFGLIDHPGDVGQLADGVRLDPSTGLGVGRPEASDWGLDRAAAVRTKSFWILALASGCVSWQITALSFHQIALLGEAGLSSSEAAAMFLPQVLGAAGVGVVAGAAVDRFGSRYVPVVAMVLMSATHVLAGTVDGYRWVFAYAIAAGATIGLARSFMTTIVPAWFGVAHVGSVSGLFGVIGVAGSAIGPVALSLTADVSGSWQTAALWWVVMPIAIALIAVRVQPPARPRSPAVSSVTVPPAPPEISDVTDLRGPKSRQFGRNRA